MHCPKLTWARCGNDSNVQTAQDAEDYVKLVFGLCAGPRAWSTWKVKAAPLGDSWLVTPTYVGPPAEVRAVGPMELVFMNRAAGQGGRPLRMEAQFQAGPDRQSRCGQAAWNRTDCDPAPAELDDPTLDYYLSRCEMVVVGTVMNDARLEVSSAG